jgi:hypothetical protein
MEFLAEHGRVALSKPELLDYAHRRAREVEASCWSPRLRISDSEYQALVIAKAHELARALLQASGILFDPLVPVPPTRQSVLMPPVPSGSRRPPTPLLGEVPSSAAPGNDDESPVHAWPGQEFGQSEPFRFFKRSS